MIEITAAAACCWDSRWPEFRDYLERLGANPDQHTVVKVTIPEDDQPVTVTHVLLDTGGSVLVDSSTLLPRCEDRRYAPVPVPVWLESPQPEQGITVATVGPGDGAA